MGFPIELEVRVCLCVCECALQSALVCVSVWDLLG